MSGDAACIVTVNYVRRGGMLITIWQYMSDVQQQGVYLNRPAQGAQAPRRLASAPLVPCVLVSKQASQRAVGLCRTSAAPIARGGQAYLFGALSRCDAGCPSVTALTMREQEVRRRVPMWRRYLS